MIQLAYDVVDGNGKTIKENNLSKPHNIPLGSFVEYNDGSGGDAIRAYVAQYQRDCDGTPLYGLSLDKDRRYEDPDEEGIDALTAQIRRLFNMKIDGGYSEECLIVLK